jgi:hypothetical protein
MDETWMKPMYYLIGDGTGVFIWHECDSTTSCFVHEAQALRCGFCWASIGAKQQFLVHRFSHQLESKQLNIHY